MVADVGDPAVRRDHSWPCCIFFVSSLSLCITTDILQYAMPLAFLPSVLEDRGRTVLEITAAVGVYYWTGFLGGVMLTSYQIWELVRGRRNGNTPEGGCTISKVRRQILYVLLALGVGSTTLVFQAIFPTCAVHTACRFLQGLAGAFIFFYAFLLSVELFKGSQQVFALTSVTCALNVAEVLGSGLGAAIFDGYGHGVVFYSLAVTSVVNQVMVGIMLIMICSRPAAEPSGKDDSSEASAVTSTAAKCDRQAGLQELWVLVKSPTLRQSVLLVTTAATVKGAVEEALPLHADHQWHFEPIRIGQAFTVVAFCYIISAVFMGRLWSSLGRYRLMHCGVWVSVLGLVCWSMFSLKYFKLGETTLFLSLAVYGTALGMCHTPAALLVAEAIEEGGDGPAGDVANGIWNTMWEAGGSVGFLLGGLLSESYFSQLQLMGGIFMICIVSAFFFFTAGHIEYHKFTEKDKSALSYGSAS